MHESPEGKIQLCAMQVQVNMYVRLPVSFLDQNS